MSEVNLSDPNFRMPEVLETTDVNVNGYPVEFRFHEGEFCSFAVKLPLGGSLVGFGRTSLVYSRQDFTDYTIRILERGVLQ